jgi:carbonic anhydrase
VEVVFDQGVGDCFVTRVAGNIATKEVIGSLEFGTDVLGSKVLLVIGHERCGAVVASMGRLDTPLPKNPGSIPTLVPYISPAVQEVADFRAKGGTIPPDADGVADDIEFTAKQNVLDQVATLKKSPILSSLISQGKLLIRGAYYDLDTGKVTILEEKLI